MLEKKGFGEQLAQHWKSLSPATQMTIGGAGAGGLLGMLSSMRRDKEERQPLASGLTGALAGGAMGFGAGMAAPTLSKWLQQAKAGPEVESHIPALDQADPEAVQKEIANRAAQTKTKLDAGLEMGVVGLAGGTVAGSRDALGRGARAYGDSYYSKVDMPDIEGKMHATPRPEEILRQHLAEGRISPKVQWKAIDEAIPSYRAPAGQAGQAGQSFWQRLKGTPKRFSPVGGRFSSSLAAEANRLGAPGRLTNRQVLGMLGKGMMPRQIIKSPGAWAGALGAMGTDYLLNRMRGNY